MDLILYGNRESGHSYKVRLMLALTRKRPEERMVSGLPAYRAPALAPAE